MAGSSIGDIVVNLKAETASFTADVAKAHGSLKTMAEAAIGLGAAMAAGLAEVVHLSIEMADKMGKLAQTTGFTTEKLSALSFAAKMVDIDQESLAKGLEKLAKNMDAASQSVVSTAFGRLGISVKDATGKLKDSDVVLGQIAERFAKMPDGAQKTALAMQLFGKAGAQLIPLLNKGKDGLEEFRKEAESLGLIVDEKTAKAAERFEEDLKKLKAASEGMALQFTAGLLPSLEAIAKALTGAKTNAQALRDMGDSLGEFLKRVTLGFVSMAQGIHAAAIEMKLWGLEHSGIHRAAEFVDNPILAMTVGTSTDKQMAAEKKKLETELAGLGQENIDLQNKLWSTAADPDNGKKAVGNLTDLAAAMEAARKKAEEFTNWLTKFSETVASQSINPYDKAFAQFDKDSRELRDKIAADVANAHLHEQEISNDRIQMKKNLNAELEKLDEEYVKKTLAELDKIAGRGAALGSALALTPGPNVKNGNANPFQVATDNLSKDKKQQAAEAVQLFDQTRTASERYSQQLNKLNILLQSGAIDQTVYNRAVVQARLTMTPMGQVVQGVGDAFGTMFQSVVTGTKSMGEAFASMAQSIVASIAQMIAKMLALWAVQKLLGLFFGGLGTATGAGSGANLNSLSSAGVGNTNFGLGIGSIAGHRAAGGSVLAGRAYMVGEMGPEPFIPATNGTILPNGMKGGDTIIVNAPNSQAGAADEWFRAMKANNKMLKQQILGEVRDRRLRGATI